MLDRLFQMISVLALLMVLGTVAVVIMRYCFGVGTVAWQEAVMIAHAMLFMLGIPYTMMKDRHVRVDVLYQKFSPHKQLWVNRLGHVLLLLPVSGFLIWVCWGYVFQSWQIGEASPETGGLPAVYLVKTLLLVMPVGLLLSGLCLLFRKS